MPTTNPFERRESDTDTGGWRKQIQVLVLKRKNDSNCSVNDNYFTSLSTDDKLVKNYDQLNANNSVIRNIEAKQYEFMCNIQVVQRSIAQATHILDQLEDVVRSQEERIQVLSYRHGVEEITLYSITLQRFRGIRQTRL